MPATRLSFVTPLSVLWRPDGALQVGLDARAGALLPEAPPQADAALRALRTPRTALEVGQLLPDTADGWLRATLGELSRRGLLGTSSPVRPVVGVLGHGVLADAVLDLLSADGFGVATPAHPRGTPAAVWLVCPDTAEPDRVLIRELGAMQAPHLVVRAEPERAVVGPFVPAGGSPCVTCTDLLRRDLDGDWPHLLAQLCRAPHTPTRLQATWAAATAVAQLAAWVGGAAPETRGATVELEASTGAVGARRWPAHPDCGCLLAAA